MIQGPIPLHIHSVIGKLFPHSSSEIIEIQPSWKFEVLQIES